MASSSQKSQHSTISAGPPSRPSDAMARHRAETGEAGTLSRRATPVSSTFHSGGGPISPPDRSIAVLVDDAVEWKGTPGIRQWRHHVARASQAFVGRCLDVDPAYLLRAVRFLARDLPAPASHAQRDVLWKEVIECASRAGLHFHAEYHRTITPGPCAGAPMNAMAVLWMNREADPRVAIRRWGRAFLPDFERTHPWPAAVRAAIILRKQRRRRVAIARLCSDLGVSKTVLAREFRALYGMSIADYRRRARTGWVVGELAGSGVCIESIALRAGYKRPGSLYDTLRSLTGLSPTHVRQLSSDDVRDVLDGPLSLHLRRIPAAGSPPLND